MHRNDYKLRVLGEEPNRIIYYILTLPVLESQILGREWITRIGAHICLRVRNKFGVWELATMLGGLN